ncbi:hypothetical protein niasHS_007457 [Heterodera schachtii]|uniref:Tetraspanin n=1 Tax=Heterodera schachtii TaxID=97005 RepID=A0ABD2JXN0_HETSC
MVAHRPAGGIRQNATGRAANAEQTARKAGEIAIKIGGPTRNGQRMAPRRGEKPRQEICGPLKWLCFAVNFFIFLASVACLALGVYLFLTDPRPIDEFVDVLLNPAVLLTSAGLFSGTVALFGLFGALRDNVCLLKLFALFVFLSYLVLVVFTCFLFLLFYSDASGDEKGISAQFLIRYSIRRYHINRNIADFVDYMQEQLECCGSTSFRDWNISEQFKCNSSNPYPERCGVPFSCCRRSVAGGANGGQNPLAPAIRSLQCWQNAQKKREQQLDSDIYVAGCLQPLRTLFDDHAFHIGFGVVSVVLPVCMAVFLSQCLARQIDYQRFLLRREERRIARAERRERRFREQQQNQSTGQLATQMGGHLAPNFGGNGKDEKRRRNNQQKERRKSRTKSSSPLRTAAKVAKRLSVNLENGTATREEGRRKNKMETTREEGRKNRVGTSEDKQTTREGARDNGRRGGAPARGAREAAEANWRSSASPRKNVPRGTREETKAQRKTPAAEPTAPAFFTLQQTHFN